MFSIAYRTSSKRILNSFTFNLSENELNQFENPDILSGEYYYVGMYNNKPMYSNGQYRMVWLNDGVDEETGESYTEGYYFFEDSEFIDVTDNALSEDEINNLRMSYYV